MRECCREYRDILILVDKFKESPSVAAHFDGDRQALERIRQFIQENWDAHVDRAGEAAWEGG